MRDLSEGEALDFLRLRDVPGKAAAQVVDVTGGRLLELLAATEVLQQGGTAQGDQGHLYVLMPGHAGRKARPGPVLWSAIYCHFVRLWLEYVLYTRRHVMLERVSSPAAVFHQSMQT